MYAKLPYIMTADPSIVAALQTLRERRQELDAAIVALERLIGDGDRSVAVEPSSSPAPPLKRRSRSGGGAAGAAKVLMENPAERFTPARLAEAMIANGWETDAERPDHAARAAANRLRQDPRFRLENGAFVFRPEMRSQIDFETTVPLDSANGVDPNSNREAV